MFIAETKIRVRYAETDQMGYVHHGNYAQYFEIARIEAIEQIGMTYNELEKNGIAMPVAHMAMDFKKPAFFDEILTVKTYVKNLPTSKFVFDYEIFNGQSQLVTQATTILVFMNLETRRPTRCPQIIINGLLPYFEQ